MLDNISICNRKKKRSSSVENDSDSSVSDGSEIFLQDSKLSSNWEAFKENFSEYMNVYIKGK